MTLQEFKDILDVCKIDTEGDFDESTPLKDLGLDSLDSSLVKYEIESRIDRDVQFVPDQTIGQLLAAVGKEEV